MHQHPAVVGALMRDRVAELHYSARAAAYNRRESRRHKLLAAARQGAGWLLVDMGLRLAVARRGTNHRVMLHRRSRSA